MANTQNTAGSYVNSAAETIASAGHTIAEKARGTVGDTVADAVAAAGDYTAAGIKKTGEAVGLQGSQGTADKLHDHADNVKGTVKDAAKDVQTELKGANRDASASAHTHTEEAKQNAYAKADETRANTKAAYEGATDRAAVAAGDIKQSADRTGQQMSAGAHDAKTALDKKGNEAATKTSAALHQAGAAVDPNNRS
jgi:hypothetical protein